MHTTMRRISMSWLLVAAALLLICLFVVDSGTIPGQWRTSTFETLDMEPLPEPLPTETIEVQGLARTVRFYIPADIPDDPALIIALHGGGGDGARFRRLTNRAFESVAEKNALVIAYPDGLGGHWNGCRSRAAYRPALAGVDDRVHSCGPSPGGRGRSQAASWPACSSSATRTGVISSSVSHSRVRRTSTPTR